MNVGLRDPFSCFNDLESPKFAPEPGLLTSIPDNLNAGSGAEDHCSSDTVIPNSIKNSKFTLHMSTIFQFIQPLRNIGVCENRFTFSWFYRLLFFKIWRPESPR